MPFCCYFIKNLKIFRYNNEKRNFIMFRCIFVCLFIISISMAHNEGMPIIVSVKWLQSHLNDKNIAIIDVRKEEAYKKGHIKGAINMPVMKDFFTPKTLRIPKLIFLKNLFSNAGIDDNTKVIVYDNGQFCWAARAVWILKVLGHKNASLLEYGWGDYIKSHLPISTKAPKREKKDKPAAACKVKHSPAADEVSIKYKPGPFLGSSAGVSTSINFLDPIFWKFPKAFSSIVVNPPAIFPAVGWLSERSFVASSKINSL
jgi:rhodanese-related sulfurtransferase